MIINPTAEWSDPIDLPERPSILRVNLGTVRIVYEEAPAEPDDGQKLSTGDSVTFAGFAGQTIRVKAENQHAPAEVYIGPWWQ